MSVDISQICFALEQLAEKYMPLLVSASDAVWEFHEPAYEEQRSCTLLKEILEQHKTRPAAAAGRPYRTGRLSAPRRAVPGFLRLHRAGRG